MVAMPNTHTPTVYLRGDTYGAVSQAVGYAIEGSLRHESIAQVECVGIDTRIAVLAWLLAACDDSRVSAGVATFEGRDGWAVQVRIISPLGGAA